MKKIIDAIAHFITKYGPLIALIILAVLMLADFILCLATACNAPSKIMGVLAWAGIIGSVSVEVVVIASIISEIKDLKYIA